MNKYFLRYKKTYGKEHPNVGCKAVVWVDFTIHQPTPALALDHINKFYDFLIKDAELISMSLDTNSNSDSWDEE